jgi:PAS domain-containing protein
MFRIFRKQFPKVQDAWKLAHAIVDTIREPLIVLDQDLRVVAASRSFYLTFKVNADDTQGKLLYDLGDGQWDIPKLRTTYQVPIGSLRSLTTAPANLTACSLNQKPDLVPVSLKRCQSSLMLKW